MRFDWRGVLRFPAFLRSKAALCARTPRRWRAVGRARRIHALGYVVRETYWAVWELMRVISWAIWPAARRTASSVVPAQADLPDLASASKVSIGWPAWVTVT